MPSSPNLNTRDVEPYVLGQDESDLSSHDWLGASDCVPLTVLTVVWKVATHLVVDHDFGSIESTTAAVFSVKDFD